MTHAGYLGEPEKCFLTTSRGRSNLQIFRGFYQTSQVGYYPYKPIKSVVYCFKKKTSNKAQYFSGEIVF